MKPPGSGLAGRGPQRGAASLIVVMLLFFVLSLTAAYTSRNLIFEQKTSANQARSTAAFEAAEAGIEWTLALLNGRTINASCTSAGATTSFQQRYLSFSATGIVTQTPRAGNSLSPRIWPTCVFNGASWDCTCPIDAAADPVAPVGAGPFPAFRVWPATPEPSTAAAPPANASSSPWGVITPARPGFVLLNSAGCTRLPGAADTCLDFIARGEIGEGISFQRTTLALRSGLAVPPAAAITARLTVAPAGLPALPLKVVNTDYRSGGYTVNTANAVADKTLFDVRTIPGTPPDLSFVDTDPKLAAVSAVAPASAASAPASLSAGERMFVSIFGMKRATYRNQPGLRVCAAPCTAGDVNTLLQDNPDRVIWVEGDLTVDADIGTPGVTPVLLVVNGDTLTLDVDRIVHGFVYLTGDGAAVANTSTIAIMGGSPQIQGALVAEGRLVTTVVAGQLTVTYDATALDRLRRTYGSWVRLGAAWRDFKVAP